MRTQENEALALALTMDESDAAFILTMAEEPELLLEAGAPAPYFPPHVVQAARIVSDWISADYQPRVFH